ncbi:MAG: protein-L-isoaspartate(D-aspartate) O-methyltransferase [Polyangiales bacterium]
MDQTQTFTELRQDMVDRQLRPRGINDERVLNAMRSVPRHLFVPDSIRHRAYEDRALPLIDDQTISQPWIVAMIAQSLALGPSDIVLDVGAGSGYQAAVLAACCDRVVAVEIRESLAQRAALNLQTAGVENVKLVVANGRDGAPSDAPFDAIAVAAATSTLSSVWFNQLVEGGRLVVPLGTPSVQELMLYRKTDHLDGGRSLCRCIFVPLVDRLRP